VCYFASAEELPRIAAVAEAVLADILGRPTPGWGTVNPG